MTHRRSTGVGDRRRHRRRRSRPISLDASDRPTRRTEIGDCDRIGGSSDRDHGLPELGTAEPARDNAVLVLHALTGDSHVVGPAGPDQPTPGWWDGLIGPGAPLDTDRLLRRSPPTCSAAAGARTGPSIVAPGRPAVRLAVSRGSPSATRSRPRSRWPTRWASTRSRRCSAARWAACGPWSGRSGTRTGCGGCIAIATCAAFTGDQIAWASPQLAAIRADRNFARRRLLRRTGRRWPGWRWPGRSRTPPTGRRCELDTRFGRDVTRATRIR